MFCEKNCEFYELKNMTICHIMIILYKKQGGYKFMNMIIFIASFVIAAVICNVINKNTIGTTGAYVKRYIVVWFITLMVLLAIFGVL